MVVDKKSSLMHPLDSELDYHMMWISNVRYGFGYTEDKVVELVIDVMTSALKATTTLLDESTVI